MQVIFPDGLCLFFIGTGGIYWVDIYFAEELRPAEPDWNYSTAILTVSYPNIEAAKTIRLLLSGMDIPGYSNPVPVLS